MTSRVQLGRGFSKSSHRWLSLCGSFTHESAWRLGLRDQREVANLGWPAGSAVCEVGACGPLPFDVSPSGSELVDKSRDSKGCADRGVWGVFGGGRICEVDEFGDTRPLGSDQCLATGCSELGVHPLQPIPFRGNLFQSLREVHGSAGSAACSLQRDGAVGCGDDDGPG